MAALGPRDTFVSLVPVQLIVRDGYVSTILILDDEAPIRTLLRVTLGSLGYAVLEAATAKEAFRWSAGAGVDLLIADVNLPGGSSGVRVALELRSLFPFLRIILTSGVPVSLWNDQDAAEWSELPSDSVIVLQKPFHAVDLLQTIRKLERVQWSQAPWPK